MRWCLAVVVLLALAPAVAAQADTNSTSASSSGSLTETATSTTSTSSPTSNATGNATTAPAGPQDPAASNGGSGGDDEGVPLLAVLLPVLVGIALIAIASLVVRHGQGHRHNVFFAALYFLSGLKSLSEGLRLKADDFIEVGGASLFPPGLFWQLLALFCALGMMPLLFLFVSSFPRPLAWMLRRPKTAVLAFVPSALMALLLVLVVAGLAPPDAYRAAVSGFNFLFFVVTVAAILLILRTRATTHDPIEHQQSIYVLLGFLPGFVAGWAISGLQFGASSGALDPRTADGLIANIIQYISPVFELLACSLVAFAILKYNILGIDPKFRVGVKSTLVGMMFIVLFLTTQFIENVVLQGQIFAFAGEYGSFLFSGVTGLVLFKPMEKVSNKVSDKLLPTTAGKDGLLPAEEIYHAQATYVLRDAKVTDRELAGLRLLRKQLKISDERARQIEEDVERILHVDDARLGQTSGEAPALASESPAAAPAPPPPAPAAPAAPGPPSAPPPAAPVSPTDTPGQGPGGPG